MVNKQSEHQEEHTGAKQNDWCPAMMMLAITMIKRIKADNKRQQYHARFKVNVMNDIDSEQRKAGKEKRK